MQEHGVLVRILASIHTINTKDPTGKKTPLSGPLCPLGDHQITKDFNHLGLVKTQDFRLQVRTLNKGPSVNAIFFCQSQSSLSVPFLKARLSVEG